jgi:hypothetical protein
MERLPQERMSIAVMTLASVRAAPVQGGDHDAGRLLVEREGPVPRVRAVTKAIRAKDPDAAGRRMGRHVHSYAEAVMEVGDRTSIEVPPASPET